MSEAELLAQHPGVFRDVKDLPPGFPVIATLYDRSAHAPLGADRIYTFGGVDADGSPRFKVRQPGEQPAEALAQAPAPRSHRAEGAGVAAYPSSAAVATSPDEYHVPEQFLVAKIRVVPELLQPAFTPEEYVSFWKKMPKWETSLEGSGMDTIDAKLEKCGLPPLKTPRMANAVLAHIAQIPLQSLKVPPVEDCRSPLEYYERSHSLQAVADYVEGVAGAKHSGSGVVDRKVTKAVEKVPLLGSTGMKGIGKTELLKQVAHQSLPKVAEKLQKTMVPLYVSFNGGRTESTTRFHECVRTRGKAGVARDTYARAFGHVLLVSCGAFSDQEESGGNFALGTALRHIRKAASLGDNDVLVLLVDEIGELGDEVALETIKAAMSAVDAARGTLVCLFAHISQEVLNKCAAMSGRKVLPLPLPALAIDIWKRVPVGENALSELAKKDAGLQQFLLSLGGHPRAVFDGIPAAREQIPSLFSDPSSSKLSLARQTIIVKCKFNSTSDPYVGSVIRQWLAREEVDEQQLICDGLLLQVPTHPDVKFLFPLTVMDWAERNSEADAIAHHLNNMFHSDAVADCGSEKFMEPVLYNFEAAKRIALGEAKLRLGTYYGEATPMDAGLKQRIVRCNAHANRRNVYKAPSFSPTHMPDVVNALKSGKIAVSENPTEVGVEYFVPFFDAATGALLVACVQCKFVKSKADWKTINVTMQRATKYFVDNSIAWFPVVYTTADQKTTAMSEFKGGVCFVEQDVFRFTNRMGILRLHCMKLGGLLKQKYPFLAEGGRAFVSDNQGRGRN